jgi:hypothetical protein
MVIRINSIAFQGASAQSIDSQISNGLPVFRIVGCILLTLLFFIPIPAKASENCPLYGTEYIPQGQEKQRQKTYDKNVGVINRTLSFVLRIEKGTVGRPTDPRSCILMLMTRREIRSAPCGSATHIQMDHGRKFFLHIPECIASLEKTRRVIVKT